MKHQVFLTIQAKLKLIYIFFYFSIAIDSGEILASVWQEEGNFEDLKRCYIQIHPTSLLQCYGKAAKLQHIGSLEWNNVELL